MERNYGKVGLIHIHSEILWKQVLISFFSYLDIINDKTFNPMFEILLLKLLMCLSTKCKDKSYTLSFGLKCFNSRLGLSRGVKC